MILLLFTVACVIVIDLTDFIDSIKRGIWKWVWKEKREFRDFNFKPFQCSLCSSFWVGLFYLIFSGEISLLLVVYQLSLSYLTPIIKDAIQFVRDFLSKIIDVLYSYLNL